MTTRTLALLCASATAGLLLDAGRLCAQQPNPGTVSWATGYPKVTPPAVPGGQGKVNSFGTYTVNPGWTANKALVYIQPKNGGAGGVPQPFELKLADGKIGLDANGQIVPAEQLIQSGTWQIWLSVIYVDANGNSVASLSSVETITIPARINPPPPNEEL